MRRRRKPRYRLPPYVYVDRDFTAAGVAKLFGGVLALVLFVKTCVPERNYTVEEKAAMGNSRMCANGACAPGAPAAGD